MADPPELPSCVSIMICDDALQDARSHKLVVFGAFNRIATQSLPFEHDKMVVCFSLTNGQGDYDFELSIEHEETGAEVCRIQGPMSIRDPLRIVDINVVLRHVPFGALGKYWVQLKANGAIIGQRPFHVAMAVQDANR